VGSPLRALPLVSWSTRFDYGEVALSGRLERPFEWLGLHPSVLLPAGSVRVRFAFSGGATPAVASIEVVGERVLVEVIDGIGRMSAGTLAQEFREVRAPMDAVLDLVDALCDPSIHVRVRPAEGLLLKLAPGVTATVPANAAVVIEAQSRGPAERPRLVSPLVVSVGGTGLSIRLPGSRWVATLASVGIRQASLAPDGEVELTGHAPPPFERAVGVGLKHASHQLSELVRTNPRFAGVREFLQDE
jgi:hypothetical protein